MPALLPDVDLLISTCLLLFVTALLFRAGYRADKRLSPAQSRAALVVAIILLLLNVAFGIDSLWNRYAHFSEWFR